MKTKKCFFQIRFYWYSLLTNLFDNKHFSKYKLKYGAILLSLAVTGGCSEKTSNNSSEKPIPKKQDSATTTTTLDSIKEQTVISSDTLPEQPKRKNKRKPKRQAYEDIKIVAIEPPIQEKPDILCYYPVEQLTVFPGGESELNRFLYANLKYPDEDKDMGIAGRVIAQFVIDKTGKVSNIKIVKSLSNNCDKEVIRVLNLMPKWIPARREGVPVAVFFMLPVQFKLKTTE